MIKYILFKRERVGPIGSERNKKKKDKRRQRLRVTNGTIV